MKIPKLQFDVNCSTTALRVQVIMADCKNEVITLTGGLTFRVECLKICE